MVELETADIGERIARYRRLNGMSAQAVADAIGPPLSRAVIANIELGKRADVGVRDILALAWAIGVPPIALILPIDTPSATISIGGDPIPVSDLVDWFNGSPIAQGEPTGAGKRVAEVSAALRSLRLSQQQLEAVRQTYVELTVTGHAGSAEMALFLGDVEQWEEDVVFKSTVLRNLGVEVI